MTTVVPAHAAPARTGRAMRIAIVSEDYPPDTARGGIGSQAAAKARGLAARGHAVHVITAAADRKERRSREEGVDVWRLAAPDERLTLYSEPARWLAWGLEVARALERLGAEAELDLIEGPEWGAPLALHLLNRSHAGSEPPVTVQLHGPLAMLSETLGWPVIGSELERQGRHLEETTLRLADSVYASAPTSADWAARAYPELDRRSMTILHTGVDTGLFAPAAQSADQPSSVLFVGRLAANKGIEELLDATMELRADFPALRLRCLGRGDEPYIRVLKERASGHAGLLDLVGFLPHEQLADELRAASLMAQPSRFEGGPCFTLLEAMASGLPVIGCSGSGAADTIDDERTGLLVPPGDRGAIVKALRRLLDDPELRSRLGMAARCWVVEHADAERCLDQLESYYRGVAELGATSHRPDTP